MLGIQDTHVTKSLGTIRIQYWIRILRIVLVSNVLATTKNENGGDVEVKHQWVVSRGLKYLNIEDWNISTRKCATVPRSYKWPLNNHFKDCIYLVCSSTAMCTLRLEHSLVRKYRIWVFQNVDGSCNSKSPRVATLSEEQSLQVHLEIVVIKFTLWSNAKEGCFCYAFAWLIMLGS